MAHPTPALRPMALVSTLAAACARPSAAPRDAAESPRQKTLADLQSLPSRPPTPRVSYGADSLQFGELSIPDGPGPHPAAVLIHGG